MSLSSPIPPPSSFTPRKEFLREQQTIKNSFALLAISGPNCVRLYSFTLTTVQTVRRLLEQYAPIISVREDADQNLCEFALDKKPWSNPKSVPSEKLLLDLIAAVYQCGYTYLSSIDYGREADDRLAMAFSRPDAVATPPSRSASPLTAPSLHAQNDSSGSTFSVGRPPAKRVPFAISFTSMTVLRVIAPPLHLTPAILQACRNSWPRGVVSEKKVYQNSYEFKLKGYGLFQEDTFATDSLHHILSLLSSLDAHSFTLLTSVSLTPNHSRVKDLWIFTGPATDDGSADLNSPSLLDVNPIHRLSLHHSTDTHASHKRQATEPAGGVSHSPVLNAKGHNRSASDSHNSLPIPTSSSVLRKGAPRAQIPVSVRGSEILDDAHAPLRAYLPSVVSSDAQNMTGVGAGQSTSPAIFYETSPLDVAGSRVAAAQTPQHSRFPTQPTQVPAPTPHAPPQTMNQPPALFQSRSRSPTYKAPSDKAKTPTPPVPSTPSPPASPINSQPTTPGIELSPTSLLGPSAFRDSAFSTATEVSREIPIKWTGPLAEDIVPEQPEPTMPEMRHMDSTPLVPGGWQGTPTSEMGHEEFTPPTKGNRTPIHDNYKRIEAPEIVGPAFDLRRSEAALVGFIKSTSPTPPPPGTNGSGGPANGGSGWVLVNVDAPKAGMVPDRQQPPQPVANQSSQSSDDSLKPATIPHHPSAEAKAIAIVDALEAKQKKTGSPLKKDESSVKRFFSINRKNSRKMRDQDEEEEDEPTQQLDVAPSTIQRSPLRDKLRHIGTPEAPRRDDKRFSID